MPPICANISTLAVNDDIIDKNIIIPIIQPN